jgi:hypothetical protein
MSAELTFPKFEDNKVSTKTVIVVTNMAFDITALFNHLPVVEYTMQPKRRGRKKKPDGFDPNCSLPSGSIITLKLENKIRGIDLNHKKTTKRLTQRNRGKFFRNSLTIVMLVEGKKVNIKACANGKLQMTGCKATAHVEAAVHCLWDYIKDYSPSVYVLTSDVAGEPEPFPPAAGVGAADVATFHKKRHLQMVIIPAMRNIDFALGFTVNREELSNFMNLKTDHISMLETSFGYTGCNCKVKIPSSIRNMPLRRITLDDDGEWIKDTVSYDEHLRRSPEKERRRHFEKDRYITLLVFYSGRVIMSGINAALMRGPYYDFLNIIREAYPLIREDGTAVK